MQKRASHIGYKETEEIFVNSIEFTREHEWTKYICNKYVVSKLIIRINRNIILYTVSTILTFN